MAHLSLPLAPWPERLGLLRLEAFARAAPLQEAGKTVCFKPVVGGAAEIPACCTIVLSNGEVTMSFPSLPQCASPSLQMTWER